MAHLHPIYGSVFLYLKIGVLNGTTLATERMIDSNGDAGGIVVNVASILGLFNANQPKVLTSFK